MITPGLLRVVYEQQEKELLSKIELKRRIAESREANANAPVPRKAQNRSFVQLLKEKIFSRSFEKSTRSHNPECATPCLENN